MNLPYRIKTFRPVFLTFAILTFIGFSLGQPPITNEQAEMVLQKAIRNLGGDKYLGVKTQIGRGRWTVTEPGTPR